MPSRPLGATGPRIFPVGLGCMGMSDFYGPADRAESIGTIHAAPRESVVLSVKFGALRDPDGGWTGVDAGDRYPVQGMAHLDSERAPEST